MKKTIETLVVFSLYMVNNDRTNLEDITHKILRVISPKEILAEYNVTMDYEDSHAVQYQIAAVIVMDLLKKKLE